MDWWVVKQLRAMVLTDLKDFVPAGYFENPPKNFKLHSAIPNARHFSQELAWGHLAGDLGRRLFFESMTIMSARQVSACEVLMNLGMLASAEASQSVTNHLSIAANEKGVPDGNAGASRTSSRKNMSPSLRQTSRVPCKGTCCTLNLKRPVRFRHY